MIGSAVGPTGNNRGRAKAPIRHRDHFVLSNFEAFRHANIGRQGIIRCEREINIRPIHRLQIWLVRCGNSAKAPLTFHRSF
jgi:hypothetical protein